MDLSTNWLFMAGRLLLVHPDTQRDFWDGPIVSPLLEISVEAKVEICLC